MTILNHRLIGWILGDGGLYRNKCHLTPRFQVYHSIKQIEYCAYKLRELRWICKPNKRLSFTRANTSVGFKSRNLKELEKYERIIYRNGKKSITDELLEVFDGEILACWYMDDGTFDTSKNYNPFLCTYGFAKEEQQKLCDLIERKFGINCHLVPMRNYYRIKFARKDNKKFANLVLPYIHPSMMYKLPMIQ